jgi:hypothetical protein
MRLTRFDGPNIFTWTILKEFKTPHYQPGDWNTIRVRLETDRIVGYVNDEVVMESNDVALREGKVGLAKFRDTKAEFKDFYLGTNAPVATPKLAPQEILAGAQFDAGSGKTHAEMIERLTSMGDAGRAALLERARELDKEAQQMRRVAMALHGQLIASALVKVMQEPEEKIDLFHAALLVAKLDHPDLETESYHES